MAKKKAKKKKSVKKTAPKKKAVAKKAKKSTAAKRSKTIVKARKKTVKAKATKKTKKAKRSGSVPRRPVTAAAADAGTVNVTMTIDFGSTPADVQSVRRIDGIALSTGRASLRRGLHTAGWDVVSPTIRPIGFAVAITEDASGNTLLNRPNERTGPDGKGAGVDTFSV